MEFDYSKVPTDFPHVETATSITGYQPKVMLTTYEGKAYRPGNTPPERYKQWMMCEGFVTLLVSKYGAQKSADISKEEFLSEYAVFSTQGQGIVTDKQLRWVVKRATAILGFSLPDVHDKPWMPRTVEVDDALIEAFIRRMDESPRTKSYLKSYVERRLKLQSD